MATSPDHQRISSEDQAWDLLAEELERDREPQGLVLVEFAEWPKLQIQLPRTPGESIITPTMMQSFLTLQETIYRTHTLILYDSIDLRALSREEREAFEFSVKVSGGSSKYDANLGEVLTKLASEMVGKMSSNHILIGALGLGLMYFSGAAFKNYLDTRAQERAAEIESVERRAILESQRYLSDQETRRMELLASAVRRETLLQDAEDLSQDAHQAIVRGLAGSRGGTALGADVDSDVANEIISRPRQRSSETEITGLYIIATVETTLADGFRVTLRDVATGEEFKANLQDRMLSNQHYEIVQRAEWSKQPLRATLRARVLRGRIVEATVTNVEPFERIDT